MDPLVSIIVITYNSAEFVLETLESTKSQTYQDIELVVSDDCSPDTTIEICRQWIEKNKKRFIRTEIITTDKNAGIPANCNRGVRAARGEWIKLIAGDDMFEPTAIESAVDYINKNSFVEVFDSKVSYYNRDFSNLMLIFNEESPDFYQEGISSDTQLRILANNLNRDRIISTLGVFLKRDLINRLGGFDEDYPLLEDTPMWVKILKSGVKFYFLDSFTMKYRIHNHSVSFNDKTKEDLILSGFEIMLSKCNRDYFFPHLTFINKLNVLWLTLVHKIVLATGNKGIGASLALRIGASLQPVRILWFKRKFKKIFKRAGS